MYVIGWIKIKKDSFGMDLCVEKEVRKYKILN